MGQENYPTATLWIPGLRRYIPVVGMSVIEKFRRPKALLFAFHWYVRIVDDRYIPPDCLGFDFNIYSPNCPLNTRGVEFNPLLAAGKHGDKKRYKKCGKMFEQTQNNIIANETAHLADLAG